MVWTIQLDYWINLIKHPFELMNTSIERKSDEKKRRTKELLNLRVNKNKITLTHCYTCLHWCWISWSSMIGKHWREIVSERQPNACQQGTRVIESGSNFHFNKQISCLINIIQATMSKYTINPPSGEAFQGSHEYKTIFTHTHTHVHSGANRSHT